MADLSKQTRDAVRDGAIQSAAHVWPLILDVVEKMNGGAPTSVLDVGCGEGHWLDVAHELLPGASLMGADLPSALRLPARVERAWSVCAWDAEAGRLLPTLGSSLWDVTLCLEMAEHVSPEAGRHLVRELCAVSSLVVWSAAIPGQGGDGHVNEQWPAYWARHFNDQGWVLGDPFRMTLWGDDAVEPWYQQNLLLGMQSPVPLSSQLGQLVEAPPHLVHPAVFDQQRALAAHWRERTDCLLGQQA